MGSLQALLIGGRHVSTESKLFSQQCGCLSKSCPFPCQRGQSCGTQGTAAPSGISVLPASALLPLQRQFAPPWSTLFHQPALELVMLLYLLWSFCHLPMSFCVLAAVVAARSLSCCPSSQEEPRDSSWHDFTPQSLASLTHCPSDSPLPLHLLVFNAFVTIVFLCVACSALIQR